MDGQSSSQNWIIPLVKKLVDEAKSVIVFCNVRGATVGCATYLAQTLGLPPALQRPFGAIGSAYRVRSSITTPFVKRSRTGSMPP